MLPILQIRNQAEIILKTPKDNYTACLKKSKNTVCLDKYKKELTAKEKEFQTLYDNKLALFNKEGNLLKPIVDA